MYSLEFTHKIIVNDVPLQWMTRIELFSSDLEQFPIMYVHILANQENENIIGQYNPKNKQRIFGFVMTANWGRVKTNGLCDVEFCFISNIPQKYNSNYDKIVLNEITHRIGLADKVSYDDLSIICESSPNSLPILQKIWKDKIEIVYGKYIPHGRLFDKMYGMIRFSASGNAPKLGKVSEYRMLYWYMVSLGERVVFSNNTEEFSFIEFYLIPTYEELVIENFSYFYNFYNFYASTKKIWELEYTEQFSVAGFNFQFAPKENLPSNSRGFESRYSELLSDDYDNISRLRQIYNRMPGRLYGYIWNIMTPICTDFEKAFKDRESFKIFYRDHGTKKGSSSKVVACFLQQAFGIEAFPIDTWVKTFIYYALGMNPRDQGCGEPSKSLQNKLYSDYKRLDKLEKLIWASSMGNKTNKTEFLDILWCQRYGTDKGSKGPCRGTNPIACSKCILIDSCAGYEAIKNEKIRISNKLEELEVDMRASGCFFGIYTENGTPRKVYTMHKERFAERDSHSGLDYSTAVKISGHEMSVEDFISSLRPNT